MPFKKSIIPYLDHLSYESKSTQSVNTVYLKDNKIIGHNTDIFGFENSFKNSKVDLTTTNDTVLYTVPAESTAIVKSILVSNDDASNACEITVTLLNTGNTVFSLFKQKDISAKTTVELLTNSLVMNEDEELKVQAENANDLHVVCSYLEIKREFQ